MAVDPDKAVFWYGCNMTRHGEVIRATTRILGLVGMDAAPTGSQASCCGSPKDASARIAEGMARRTVTQLIRIRAAARSSPGAPPAT